jgi:hypothetical protein
LKGGGGGGVSIGCGGSPHRDELEDSMKVDLWAGVAQSGQRLMTWWGDDRKPHMKPMKLRASRRPYIKRYKPP